MCYTNKGDNNMELREVIFISDLPSIDLHGLDRDTARVKVLEFIKDNKTMKKDVICIVHGVGSGTIKQEVHMTLKKSKDIVDFKLLYNNVGCTIAKIKIDI